MKIPSWTAQPGKKETVPILGAFCLFLSTIEYLIPKPVPFMRIGIANLPLMLALDILPFGAFLLLLGIKVIGQALITGTLFSYIFLFSLAGTGVSALSMFGFRKLLGPKRMSLAGISILGALLSNGAQLVLARVFIFGESTRYITPPFLAMGLITGLALGLFCEYFIHHSRWYAARCAGNFVASGAGNFVASSAGNSPTKVGVASDGVPDPAVFVNAGETAGQDQAGALKAKKPGGAREQARERRQKNYESIFSGGELCLAGMLMAPALVFNPNPYFRILQFLFFWFLAWLSGKKNNPLMTILIILGIVMFNLLIPYGQVLFSIGVFRITQGALLAGIQRGVTLEGLIMLSRIAIRRDLRIPGAFGELVGESFRILALIQEQRHTITGKNFIDSIDTLMVNLSGSETPAETDLHDGEGVQQTVLLSAETSAQRHLQRSSPRDLQQSSPRRSSIPGRIILAAAVLMAWIPWMHI